jgi:hypothetical protein
MPSRSVLFTGSICLAILVFGFGTVFFVGYTCGQRDASTHGFDYKGVREGGYKYGYECGFRDATKVHTEHRGHPVPTPEQ